MLRCTAIDCLLLGYMLMWVGLTGAAFAQASVTPTGIQAPATSLVRAHAHNDYEHEKPLMEALSFGFRSIEADVHLVGDELLVGHDSEDLTPERTLQSLYLDPLQEYLLEHQGTLYNDASLILLIDIKTGAEPTYLALVQLLRQYEPYLTVYQGEETRKGPVSVIVSGNRPREIMASQETRYAAYDGRLKDLRETPDAPVAFIPLVSSSWYNLSLWKGDGPMPKEDRRKVQQAVFQAHRQGRLIRFWATPDNPAVWRTLYELEVDLINTDDLQGLAAFLKSR